MAKSFKYIRAKKQFKKSAKNFLHAAIKEIEGDKKCIAIKTVSVVAILVSALLLADPNVLPIDAEVYSATLGFGALFLLVPRKYFKEEEEEEDK